MKTKRILLTFMLAALLVWIPFVMAAPSIVEKAASPAITADATYTTDVYGTEPVPIAVMDSVAIVMGQTQARFDETTQFTKDAVVVKAPITDVKMAATSQYDRMIVSKKMDEVMALKITMDQIGAMTSGMTMVKMDKNFLT